MSLFSNLGTEGLAQSEDRLGGFQAYPSDIYVGKVKMAFADAAASGAQSVTVILDLNGKEYSETIYITNKEGKNFFMDKQDKTKKVPLPGFSTINDLCLVATAKPLAEQEAEDKLVKVYDKDTKGQIPKSKPVLVDLIGKEVAVAISQRLENKQAKDGNGVYQPTAESVTRNSIDKVFDVETKLTVVEVQNNRPAEFWDAWLKQNKDKTQDRRTIKEGGGNTGRPPVAGKPSSAPAGGANAAPKRSLFGS
jgi:hypothetical protein